MYKTANRSKDKQIAKPSKYPQGYFNDKPCKECNTTFKPNAPSEHYCSEGCRRNAYQSAYLKRTHNITLTDYENMLKAQNHRCAICKGEGFVMSSEKMKHVNKLVVDHCHTTGKIRGLLCHNCNRALGLFKDNTLVLQRAIDYLNV